MQSKMILKARARRRVALRKIAESCQDATSSSAFHSKTDRPTLNLLESLTAHRAVYVENIFAV